MYICSACGSTNPLHTCIGHKPEAVHHPAHYNMGKIEVIAFIEDQKLGFHEGNAVKYIARAAHKGNRKQDLEKARWYLDRLIESLPLLTPVASTNPTPARAALSDPSTAAAREANQKGKP